MRFAFAPGPDKVRHSRVAAHVALGPEFLEQCLDRAAVGPGPARIRRQRLPQSLGIRGQLR